MSKIKKILITAGPTREHLDPVRFLTNLSTGEMGYSLARAAKKKGYKITLVSGPTNLEPPKGAKFYPVTSAAQMKKICVKLFPNHDCLIMTAAVCDFMPAKASPHKVPSASGLSLKLERTPDILASLSGRKGRRIAIGFCLETKDLIKRAEEKLRKKKLDGIVGNYYNPVRQVPFGRRNIEAVLVSGHGKVEKLKKISKGKLSGKILGWMEALNQRRGKNLFYKNKK